LKCTPWTESALGEPARLLPCPEKIGLRRHRQRKQGLVADLKDA